MKKRTPTYQDGKTCINCKYMEQEKRKFFCRRYPKSFELINMIIHWCGEFKKREVKR